jgi:hypothetical protein
MCCNAIFAVYYSGVENSGIADNLAFVTADLSLFSINFNLLDMMQVPLCDETMVAGEDNQYACPGDGTQNYEVVYKLPSAGSEQTSWIASGWDGSGLIQMFAQQDESMKIGECTLQLKTYVTRPVERNSLLSTPSAAATVGIVLASLAVAGLLLMYCYCCCKRRKAKNSKLDDEESRFQRMEEEKSYWSGAGSRRSKKSVATKSVATKTIETKKEGEGDTVISELPE